MHCISAYIRDSASVGVGLVQHVQLESYARVKLRGHSQFVSVSSGAQGVVNCELRTCCRADARP
jgi:hypothetical protein